uniref:(northern house mosquito) hypothetical protein n=1 Tax=Culex pipiens TaxID=7175 RepID=A0A8D8BVD2_CULPI
MISSCFLRLDFLYPGNSNHNNCCCCTLHRFSSASSFSLPLVCVCARIAFLPLPDPVSLHVLFPHSLVCVLKTLLARCHGKRYYNKSSINGSQRPRDKRESIAWRGRGVSGHVPPPLT